MAVNERLTDDTRRFSCDHCKAHVDRSQRAHLLCGHLPRAEWPALECECGEQRTCRFCDSQRYVSVAGAAALPTICPGYSTRLPGVVRAIRAWSWFDKGQLLVRFPEPDDNLLELIEIFNSARASAIDYEMKERTRKAEKSRGH